MSPLFRNTPPLDFEEALSDREIEILPPIDRKLHAALGTPIDLPIGDKYQEIFFGFGCFWGAERIMWQQEGVVTTAVGYMGGYTKNPTYEEVCTGITGHLEAVRVVFDPTKTSTGNLLKVFFENHNPTTIDRQGNDQGTQYRSGIYYTSSQQAELAHLVRDSFNQTLYNSGYGQVVTEIRPATSSAFSEVLDRNPDPQELTQVAGPFYYAEDYHQQYLYKNPEGYCMHGANGFTCKIPGSGQ